MNVFVLSTGRCGSTSFIKASGHIQNYSCGHETKSTLAGTARLDYPENHIEADNRLSWLLGRVDERYGNDALYVHLIRNRNDAVQSFARRSDRGIMRAYRDAILMGGPREAMSADIAKDYYDTVNSNIASFLKDKRYVMRFPLEQAKEKFAEFWVMIGAEGDIEAALREWNVPHNASTAGTDSRRDRWKHATRKLKRLVRKFPAYVRDA